MNIFRRHVPVRRLAEYLTGELSLLKRVDVESHVAVCERCAGKLADVERLIAWIRTDAAFNTSSSVIESAIQLFRSKKSRPPSSFFDLPRRVLAILRFDSAGMAPAFGVRSGQTNARQLLFNAGANQIDLHIESITEKAWTVSGQILGGSSASGSAVLQNAMDSREDALNEMSEFVFTSVQPGTYRLVLKLMKTEIEIEDIRIGS